MIAKGLGLLFLRTAHACRLVTFTERPNQGGQQERYALCRLLNCVLGLLVSVACAKIDIKSDPESEPS